MSWVIEWGNYRLVIEYDYSKVLEGWGVRYSVALYDDKGVLVRTTASKDNETVNRIKNGLAPDDEETLTYLAKIKRYYTRKYYFELYLSGVLSKEKARKISLLSSSTKVSKESVRGIIDRLLQINHEVVFRRLEWHIGCIHFKYNGLGFFIYIGSEYSLSITDIIVYDDNGVYYVRSNIRNLFKLQKFLDNKGELPLEASKGTPDKIRRFCDSLMHNDRIIIVNPNLYNYLKTLLILHLNFRGYE